MIVMDRRAHEDRECSMIEMALRRPGVRVCVVDRQTVSAIETALEEAIARQGRLDGVVVVQRLTGAGTGELEACDAGLWDEAVVRPLRETFKATRAAVDAFLGEGTAGRLVHVLLGARESARLAGDDDLPFATLVDGVLALVRSTAREYGRRGIACNLVVAGHGVVSLDTEVSTAVGFFASEDSAFVTGEVLHTGTSSR